MEKESRRQFRSRMDAKQDVWRAIPALMGNGSGTIEVPNQPGYVYIRIGDGDLGQAFNNRCPLRDNLAIYVGYDPVTDPDKRIFQVLSVRMADYANAGNTIVADVVNHHATHEFGGGDDVYVDWRRLLGFRVGRPAGFVVTVDQGCMVRAGAWAAIAAQTVDLSASQPGGINLALYVLVALDSAGTITTTDGAAVAAATLTIADCPLPASGEMPLAAVRLYTTQTAIEDTPTNPDIVDLRFPQTYVSGGSNAFGAGTLTVATINDVTIANHTHAITSSSNPGAAASILATNASGNLTIGGTFTTNGGRIHKVTTYTDTCNVLVTDEVVVFNKATAFTATMPAAVVGQEFIFKNIGAGNVTLAFPGVDTVDEVDDDIIMTQYDSQTLICRLANKWIKV